MYKNGDGSNLLRGKYGTAPICCCEESSPFRAVIFLTANRERNLSCNVDTNSYMYVYSYFFISKRFP
jgi:hypothetical protein